MANSTSNNTMAALLEKVAALESKVDELLTLNKAPSGSKGKKAQEGKEAKPRAPSSWNLFVKRVTDVLKADGQPTTGILFFCSHLKASHEAYGDLEDEDILMERASWTPPEAKPKADKPKPESDGEAKPKAKRVLSEEQKAKMAAGRKAAAERKKAEKAAEAAAKEASDAEVAAVPKPKAAEPPKADGLKRWPYKGKVYLKDEATGGMWVRNADGTKGEWAGVMGKDGKLDASVAEA